jgi:WD40 repeat protein
LWDLRDTRRAYKCIYGCFEQPAVDSVAFHPTASNSVLYAAAGKDVYIFDLRKEGVLDKVPLSKFRVSDSDVEAIAVTDDGSHMATGDTYGRVHYIDLPNTHFDSGEDNDDVVKSRVLGTAEHPNVISSLAFRRGRNELLISGCLGGKLSQTNVLQDSAYGDSITFFNAEDMQNGEGEGVDMGQMINPPLCYAVATVCDGACVLSANGDGALYLFDAETMGCEDMAEQAHGSIINSLHVVNANVGGTSFLSGGTDKVVQAWDIVPDTSGSDAQWDLVSKWKLLHPEKINALSGPVSADVSTGGGQHVPFVVADVSKDIRVYEVQ